MSFMSSGAAPYFTTRVPVQFISDDKPTLSITSANPLTNNMSALKIVTGSNVKIDQDINGIPHYRGDGEAPPFSLQLEWKELGYNDYLRLSKLRPYYVTFITFRNLGYYGKLVMDGPESVPAAADIVHATGNFYPIAPSDDGGAASINRLATPTTLSNNPGGANTGGIPAGADEYYWLTFLTAYGETTPQGPQHWAVGGDQNSNQLSWSWPSSPWIQSANVYLSKDNVGTNSRLAANVPVGFSALWTDYVGYSGLTINQALPSANTAYTGSWQAGIWVNG